MTRTVVYYAVLFASFAVAWRSPTLREWLRTIELMGATAGGAGRGAQSQFVSGAGTAAWEQRGATAAAMAMIVAALLALPVAWLYTLTRHKKGYRQSVVQTLVMLPMVVAGVVVLVKSSLALAFSLAGVVAAVRFRNTLEDSKDAVFIFLATALGIASGVELGVAIMLSILFSALVLILWVSDFGGSPASYEGRRAERQLERTARLNRTGSFVARVDDELLKAMSPEQLDALADRAWRRRKRNAPELDEQDTPRFDTLLRVRTTDVAETKRLAGSILKQTPVEWRLSGVVHEDDGTHTVEYGVRLADGVSVQSLYEALCMPSAPFVVAVEVR